MRYTALLNQGIGEVKFVEGEFEWISGLPVTYDNWAVGEPNGHTVENCSTFYVDGIYEGKWNDVRCSREYRFVCEYQ